MAGDNNFGENLRRIRREKNITQVKLAKTLTMQANAISRYEKGQIVPSLDMVYRLAYGLGINASDLLDVAKPIPKSPSLESPT